MMSPIGPPHRHFLRLLTDWSYPVQQQTEPIAIHVHTALLSLQQSKRAGTRPCLYRSAPQAHSSTLKAEEVLLLIEVTKSSTRLQSRYKVACLCPGRHCRSWIANPIDEQIGVNHKPSSLSYRNKTLHRGNDPVHPLSNAFRGAASVAIVRAVGTTHGALRTASFTAWPRPPFRHLLFPSCELALACLGPVYTGW